MSGSGAGDGSKASTRGSEGLTSNLKLRPRPIGLYPLRSTARSVRTLGLLDTSHAVVVDYLLLRYCLISSSQSSPMTRDVAVVIGTATTFATACRIFGATPGRHLQ